MEMENVYVSKYQQLAYLIGCYVIVADLHIDAIEVNELDKYLSIDENSELFHQRQQIFSDDKQKPSLRSLIDDLKLMKLTNEQKEDIIRLLMTIAYANVNLDLRERKIIEDVGKAIQLNPEKFFNKAKSQSDKDIESKKLKWYEKLHGIYDKALFDLSINKSKNFFLNRLLGGKAFANVLEKITKEAEADINRVSHLLNDFNDTLKKELTHLSTLTPNKSKDKYMIDVQEMLSNTRDHIKEIIKNSLKENILTLEKKKNNMRFFTIAFMGRTKAGKSTFHKAITLQEDDDIGIGKLRTTRYNRSWYWDRLRIVDTPGIGAPGGETDTNIAKSIIDEADMICYIVTNDSIQETEFDFFETIKERNKPLYIILNVKSNLSESIRLKKFLKDPSAWRTATGPQSLEGHYNRIKDMLAGKYNMDAVKIIPLHLLAAKISNDKKHTKGDSQKLRNGSNIDEFIQSIKKEIFDSGTLKKSMSIIDGSAYIIHTINNLLSNDYANLKYSLDNLKKSQTSIVKIINDETEKLKKDLSRILSTSQNSLKNRASLFAEENYDNHSASSAWENDYNVKSICRNMETHINNRFSDFTDTLKDKMEEILSDIVMLQQSVTFETAYTIEGITVRNTKLAANIIVALAGVGAGVGALLGWNPGGWLLLALSGAAFLVDKIFHSKSEKIKEAQNKMRETLCQEIDKSIDKCMIDVQNSANKLKNDILSNLKLSIGEYIGQTEKTLHRMEALIKSSSEIENSINSLAGTRILDYIGKSVLKDKKIDELSDEELRVLYPVDRKWGKHLLRYKYETYCSDEDRKKAEKATQMNIVFNQ